ncbi:MAG: MarR family transcriptional regulator [Bacteroidetes bacterium]|nr:MarR family transcriptional regulator [Bacteroidota bacterium]
MVRSSINDEVLHFAEDMGVVMEHSGIPRIAGKIYALLLIIPRSQLSADEIANTLKASRASISTMTRVLLQADLIDKVGVTGDRRTYYRIKPGTLGNLLRGSKSQISVFRNSVAHGLTLVKDKNSDAYHRLTDMLDFYSFLEREFPLLIERWETERPRRARS